MYIYIILLSIIILLIYRNHITELFNAPISIQKIYIVNLDHSKKRLHQIHKQCTRESLLYERISAVNGETLDIDRLFRNNIISDRSFNKGNVGCSLSHIHIWKKIMKTNNTHNLILEDDVIICNHFLKKFFIIQKQIPTNYDIVYIGGTNIYGKQYSKNLIIPVSSSKYGHSTNTGAYAILINKKCIPLLIKHFTKITSHLDIQIKELFSKLNVYYIHKPLINHDNIIRSDRKIINGNNNSINQWLLNNQNRITII